MLPQMATSRAWYPRLADCVWLRQQYIGDGRSLESIAREIGCTKKAVQFALERHGIPSRPGSSRGGPGRPTSIVFDIDDIRRRLERGDTLRQIADDHDITVQSLRPRLRRQGLQLPGGRQRSRYLWDEQWIRRAYETERRSTLDIAAELGTSITAVSDALVRFGMVPRSKGSRRVAVVDLQEVQRLRGEGWTVGRIAGRYGLTETALRSRLSRLGIRIQPRRSSIDQRLYDAAWLRHRYLDDRRTLDQIAEELHCGHTTVWRALRRYGINRRRA